MKNKLLIITIILSLGVTSSLFSQNYKWTKTQASTGNDQTWDVVVDSNNNT